MPKNPKPAPRATPILQVAPDQWAALNVERWPIANLKPHPKNVRVHPAAQLDELRESFAEHGVVKPFVIDEGGTILSGHGSTEALRAFAGQGVTELPVVVVRGWSEDQKLKFMLRDNKLGERSSWDKAALGLQLADLSKLPGADLTRLGFKPAELNRLLPREFSVGAGDPDAAPPVAPPVSRTGDIWLMGDHRLICGDATNAEHVAALFAGVTPNLMVTDPPYGVDYDPGARDDALADGARSAVGKVSNDGNADWRLAWALFPGDVAYVWHADRFAGAVEASLVGVGFEIVCQVIWAKDGHVLSRGDYHFQHEPCWYVVRKGAKHNWTGDRSQSTLWSVARNKANETGHGTQKPIECMRRPMVNNSRAGDAVYDPFVGSGTTIIAAETCGRKALAIEIDPAYVDVAVRRWEGFAGKNAILAAGEKRFADVAAERGAAVPAAKPSLVKRAAALVGVG